MNQQVPQNYNQIYRPMPPQVNAVKIDIIEPKAYGSAAPMQQDQAFAPQYYNYPAAPMYAMPQQQTYSMPQAPVYVPATQAAPMPTYSEPVVSTPAPVYSQPEAIAPGQVYAPPVSTAPAVVQNATQIVNTPPVVPPPAIVDQASATQATTVPVANATPTAPAAAPQVQLPVVNVNEIDNALVSQNLDEQTQAIQKIAEIGQNNPQQAAPLLNEKTFNALADIITKDTSTLAGPKEGQTELSPLEKAEMNKQFGTYTLAVLQKNFRDAVNVEAKNQGLPAITVNELPGIVQIVDNLKSNPNPVVREASIQALNYIAQPEDKSVLKTIFEIAAKQDADPTVKNAAQKALNGVSV